VPKHISDLLGLFPSGFNDAIYHGLLFMFLGREGLGTRPAPPGEQSESLVLIYVHRSTRLGQPLHFQKALTSYWHKEKISITSKIILTTKFQ